MYGAVPGPLEVEERPRRRTLRWVILGVSSVAMAAVLRNGQLRHSNRRMGELRLAVMTQAAVDPHTCNATATMSALASELEACESAGGASS